MKWSIEKRLIAGFGFALILASSVGAGTYGNTLREIGISNRLRETRDVIIELKDTLSAVRDAETGQRGYLITGDQDYLAPYNEAASQIDGHLRRLTELEAGNPQDERQIGELRHAIHGKLGELRQTIELRRAQGFEAAQRVVVTHRGKRDMDGIRRIVTRMVNKDLAEWGRLSKQRETARRNTLRAVCALIVVEFALLSFVYGLINRDMAERKRAAKALEEYNAELEAQNQELEAQRRQLEQTAQGLTDANVLLEQASRRFQELFQGLPVACFCYDGQGRIVEWNRTSETLYGIRPADILSKTIGDILQIEEDPEVGGAILECILDGKSLQGLELAARRAEGAAFSVLCSTFPYRDSRGEVVGGICVTLDITKRKESEESLRASERYYRLLFEDNPQPMWVYDPESLKFLAVNAAAQAHYGYTRDEFLAMTIADIRPAEDVPALRAQVADSVTKSRVSSGLARHRQKDGTLIDVEITSTMATFATHARARLVLAQDVTERRRAQEERERAHARLEALATLDGLTGLKNHRAFQERLAAEFARAQRYHMPLSLLLLDVDHFKQYNDAFGHPAGDEVLTQVARQMEECARDADFVARYGGEEFVVILPHTDSAGALAVGERFRASIAAASWPARAVTASFGAATLTAATRTGADLIAEADQALYRAKAQGRNRVVHARDLTGGAPVGARR